jgi:hypothetical protein
MEPELVKDSPDPVDAVLGRMSTLNRQLNRLKQQLDSIRANSVSGLADCHSDKNVTDGSTPDPVMRRDLNPDFQWTYRVKSNVHPESCDSLLISRRITGSGVDPSVTS